MGDRNAGFIIILFSALGLFGFSFSYTAFAMDEPDCNPYYEFRSIDGTCNNLGNPLWGSAGIELLRDKALSAYPDDGSTPAGEGRENPRKISNNLSAQDSSIPNSYGASDFIWQWGQFLDHDISLTPSSNEPAESFDIVIDFYDPTFNKDPDEFTNYILFNRSIHNEDNPTNGKRQQINQITSFIDASNVYGSDDTLAEFLRDPENPAKLKTSKHDLLPEVNGFFVAGDVRANEQIGLTAMHTLFVREHNRLAHQISEDNPELSDEQVYQIARKIVGAKIQVITYNEFLPKLLGENTLSEYSGYDEYANPGIRNEFSTASYRYGHSQLSPSLMIVDNSYMAYVPLDGAFFNPPIFKEKGLDAILRGLANQKAQEIDNKVVDAVRNFLFGPPLNPQGFDLASLNIQRGRDHGLADYNTVRDAYGLQPKASINQITLNVELREALTTTYGGNVNDIDLWVGGLAEDHVPGAMVGETIQTILAFQFEQLRDGDRFWYEIDPFFDDHPEFYQEVTDTTLAKVIKQNTNINDSKLQDDVFTCQYMKGGGKDKKHGEFEVCN